jgi:hypothetical protein
VTPEECQKQIIEQFEQLTEKKVLLVDDGSLSTHATLRVATSHDPAHVLRYRSSMQPQLPYLVASQCGLVLRILQTSDPLRFDLTSTSTVGPAILQLTHAQLQKNGEAPAETAAVELSKIFQNALGVQLRSIPVSLRVEDWIRNQFPALQDMQKACTIQHLAEGMATLAPQVRKNIPNEVFAPSAGMNAALAGYWARTLDDPSLVLGYKATGFWTLGSTLLDHFDAIAPEPDNDRQLVQTWIDSLGLQNWYSLKKKPQN